MDIKPNGKANQHRHAYLITAYDNLYVLDKLVKALDDEKNDIFIHCDRKFTEADGWIKTIPQKLTKSNIYFINRQDVKWGNYAFTDVILDLLATAAENHYFYYHLITGTSFPIKPISVIRNFYESDPQQLIYFHINAAIAPVIQERCKAYYPLVNSKYFRGSKLLKALSLLFGKLQILCGINRLRHSNMNPVYNGWGWFSIPHDFAEYAIQQREIIEKTFKYTLAPDEMWIHTVAMHSPFKDRVLLSYKYEDAAAHSKMFQDWERGKPYTFTMEDYDLLMNENNLSFFARKFSDKNKDLVDKIFRQIKVNI